MMLDKIKSLFARPPKITTYVLFDGDQLTSNEFSAIHSENRNTKYTFLTVATVPKVITQSGVDMIKPAHIGKESVDMLIASLVTKECVTNKHLTNIVVVSSDGDMLGIMVNISSWYPKIMFTQLSATRRKTSDRALAVRNSLPSNVQFIKYKMKNEVSK